MERLKVVTMSDANKKKVGFKSACTPTGKLTTQQWCLLPHCTCPNEQKMQTYDQ